MQTDRQNRQGDRRENVCLYVVFSLRSAAGAILRCHSHSHSHSHGRQTQTDRSRREDDDDDMMSALQKPFYDKKRRGRGIPGNSENRG